MLIDVAVSVIWWTVSPSQLLNSYQLSCYSGSNYSFFAVMFAEKVTLVAISLVFSISIKYATLVSLRVSH